MLIVSRSDTVILIDANVGKKRQWRIKNTDHSRKNYKINAIL